MSETIDSASAAASTLFLGHNGEWWDFWLITSVVIAALAATAIGITTAGSIVSHKREAAAAEDALEKFKLITEQKISESNARAEEAKLALEKYRAPRVLTNDGMNRVCEKIKKYAGSRFDLTVPVNMEEGSDLAVAIPVALNKAGWIGVPIPGAETPPNSLTSPSHGIGTTQGVFGVAIGLEAADLSYRTIKKADDLVRALKDEGISAFIDAERLPPMTAPVQIMPIPADNPIIHVRIGNKP